MSVISVQATTAKYRLPGLDERSLGEFDSMAASSRQALTEMRGLLAILRGGRDADLAPQPTIDDIHALVDITRGSGASVDLALPSLPSRPRMRPSTPSPHSATSPAGRGRASISSCPPTLSN